MSHALTHGALCNGIGGFALAARKAGIRTIWTCETDPFCNAVSRRHFPSAHQYGTIYDVHHPPRPDIISAGYPCQPVSLAGHRAGAADDRWLWPEVLRLVAQCRPGWFLGENVAGHVTMGLDGVLSDLEAAGYEVWPVVIPACALDAPHRRDRVWIIAHAHDDRRRHRPHQPQSEPQCHSAPDPGALFQAAAHPDSQRRGQPPGLPITDEPEAPQRVPGPGGSTGPAEPGNGWPLSEPPLRPRADGLPAHLVRPDGTGDAAGPPPDPRHWRRHALRAVGNALVPQIPALFFQFIADHEAGLILP
ncbi:DNA cytosine methyltransferase [Hymenobacter artigasi]|uniref:DNA cytosine methyltransferase n=1 Tax=Hymenobacter artigasi TaxID=2719616 RepID=UPI001446DDC6